jgi:hypothetical protein
MKCQWQPCGVEFPDKTLRNGLTKRFCCDRHRKYASHDKHTITPAKLPTGQRVAIYKRPKRIRSRERERLYTVIHKGETLEQLRAKADKALGFPEDWGKIGHEQDS